MDLETDNEGKTPEKGRKLTFSEKTLVVSSESEFAVCNCCEKKWVEEFHCFNVAIDFFFIPRQKNAIGWIVEKVAIG